MAITLIGHTQVTSTPTNTITFSSIPGTYSDLWLLGSFRTVASGGVTFDQVYMKLNNNASANINYTQLYANNPNTISYGAITDTSEQIIMRCNVLANTQGRFSVLSLRIPNYANTSHFKQYRSDSHVQYDGTNYASWSQASQFRSTAAITSISFRNDNAVSFEIGTTVTLYGITRA